MFVVLQAHVEERLVALHHRRLEKQRFLHRPREDVVDIGDLLHQPPRLRLEAVRRPEIRPHTVPQRCRLAHVNDVTLRVLEYVHTWSRRETGQLFLELSCWGAG